MLALLEPLAAVSHGTKQCLHRSDVSKIKFERLTRPFLLGLVFFRTALPCSGGYHMERGGMPLHDAVGVNCKKGATTENQGSGVKYMGLGCILTLTVCVFAV